MLTTRRRKKGETIVNVKFRLYVIKRSEERKKNENENVVDSIRFIKTVKKKQGKKVI